MTQQQTDAELSAEGVVVITQETYEQLLVAAGGQPAVHEDDDPDGVGQPEVFPDLEPLNPVVDDAPSDPNLPGDQRRSVCGAVDPDAATIDLPLFGTVDRRCIYEAGHETGPGDHDHRYGLLRRLGDGGFNFIGEVEAVTIA